MQNWGVRRYSFLMSLAVALFAVATGSATALAVASSSSNYQVVETEFGSSDANEQCSGQYCARASIGDLSISGTTGAGGTATFGGLTTNEPLLEVIVEAGQSSVGTLTPDQTTSKTVNIRVRNYLSGGYTMQLVGQPPKFGTHVLAAPTVPTVTIPGTEQFGINLVANSSPSIGSDPVQVPAGQQTFGAAEPDYSTPDQFKYVSEDVVARGTTDWGQTNYTLTMIINISNTTPAGHFSGDYAVIVTPFY